MIKQDFLIGVIEASEILKIHPESVRRLYRQKKLVGQMVGHNIMFGLHYIRNVAEIYDNRRGNKARSPQLLNDEIMHLETRRVELEQQLRVVIERKSYLENVLTERLGSN